MWDLTRLLLNVRNQSSFSQGFGQFNLKRLDQVKRQQITRLIYKKRLTRLIASPRWTKGFFGYFIWLHTLNSTNFTIEISITFCCHLQPFPQASNDSIKLNNSIEIY